MAFDTDGQHDESILQELKQITASQANIDIISRYERREEMQEYLITVKVLGTGLSVILLLVGVMNFVNTMVVNVNTRRYELAVLESIGMTKRQIKRMLFMEGFYYWGGSPPSLHPPLGNLHLLLYIFYLIGWLCGFSPFLFSPWGGVVGGGFYWPFCAPIGVPTGHSPFTCSGVGGVVGELKLKSKK